MIAQNNTPQDYPLSNLLSNYIRERPGLERRSADQLQYTLNNFTRYLLREPTLADLNKEKILDFMRHLVVTLEPKTVNNNRTNLLTLWNFAADENLIVDPPRIRKLKNPTRIPVVWSMEEIQQLYAATDLVDGYWGKMPRSEAWRLALSILWDTGTRIGELRKAELTSVNITNCRWLVPAKHTKTKQSDVIYKLRPETIELVKKSLKYPREKLIPFPKGRNLNTCFQKLLKLAGLLCDRYHGFHCIRRTAETFAAAAKGIVFASDCIGHSLAVARKYYVNPTYIERPSLIDALPRLECPQ